MSFRKLPKEIRKEIFELALPDDWEGKMPNLIQALRCSKDTDVYAEALFLFHARNYRYTLNLGNDYGFKDMPLTLISTIGKIRIIVEYVYSCLQSYQAMEANLK